MPADRDPQTHAIIGACMEVHNELGCGYLEPVYQEAVDRELELRGIPFRREVVLPVCYKGSRLSCSYKADFVCYDSIILEMKALGKLTTLEYSIIINYLKASGYQRGLLVNFGSESLEFKRFIRSQPSDHHDQ